MTNAVLKPIPMNWDYQFTLPPIEHKGSLLSTSSLIPVVSCLFVIVMLPGINWYLVVWFPGARIWPNKPNLETVALTFVLCCLSMPHLLMCCAVVSVVSDSLQPHGPCSPLGSSVHMFLQAWRLGWVAVCSSKGSSPPEIYLFLLHLLHWQTGSIPENEARRCRQRLSFEVKKWYVKHPLV